jgi:hypothetical protein
MLSREEIQREIERAKAAPAGNNEYSRREKESRPTQTETRFGLNQTRELLDAVYDFTGRFIAYPQMLRMLRMCFGSHTRTSWRHGIRRRA